MVVAKLLRRLLYVGTIMVAMFVVFSDSIYANDYQLYQEILPVPCESTPDAPLCPMKPPTVGAVSVNKGRPFLTGLYDADKSVRLLVEVADRVYELGVDFELTSIDGVWTLDLTELVTPLVTGNYEIWVTTIDSYGSESRGQGQLIVEQSTLTPPDVPQEGRLSSTGQAMILFITTALVLLLSAVLLFIYSKRSKK